MYSPAGYPQRPTISSAILPILPTAISSTTVRSGRYSGASTVVPVHVQVSKVRVSGLVKPVKLLQGLLCFSTCLYMGHTGADGQMGREAEREEGIETGRDPGRDAGIEVVKQSI
jgi:hypothetical protein